MPSENAHDDTNAVNIDATTRRPLWSSRQEHLRHRIQLRRTALEDQDTMQDNTSENDLSTESDEISTTDSVASVSINVSWVNTPRVNSSQHSNEMLLEAFLQHPYVSEIEFTDIQLADSTNSIPQTHNLEWNTNEDIQPEYVLHSMSNDLYEGNAVQHQDRISKMINSWAMNTGIDIVASTMGVYDTDNRSLSILDIIGQGTQSKSIYIAFVLFEDCHRRNSWHDRLLQSGSKLQRLAKFAKYNQQLLQAQFNINSQVYLLGTSSIDMYPPQFEFEFRI
jgi:hypothetical protein